MKNLKRTWKMGLLVAAISIAGCAGQSAGTTSFLPPTVGLPPRAMRIAAPMRGQAQVTLIASLSRQISAKQLSDGALLDSSSSINGYFGNYAAMGLVVAGNYGAAQRWAQWYVTHLNPPNSWGPGCSIYDYRLVGGVETSTRGASSVDAHGASFITLLRTMYASGNPSLTSYVSGMRSQAECVAWSTIALIAPNHLAQVKPGNGIEYLIDNTQVFRGLGDMAWLEANVWNNPTGYATYTNYQSTIAQGINALWNPSRNMYASYTTIRNHIETPSWSTWYADSTAQLCLVINQVLPPTDPRAIALYDAFNAAWPNWTAGASANPSHFPWALVAQAAGAMGDLARVSRYAANAQTAYGSAWGWPWYDYESSSLIRALAAPTFP